MKIGVGLLGVLFLLAGCDNKHRYGRDSAIGFSNYGPMTINFHDRFSTSVSHLIADSVTNTWMVLSTIERLGDPEFITVKRLGYSGTGLMPDVPLGKGKVADMIPYGEYGVLVAILRDGSSHGSQYVGELVSVDSHGNIGQRQLMAELPDANAGDCPSPAARQGFWGEGSIKLARIDSQRFAMLQYSCRLTSLSLWNNMQRMWTVDVNVPRDDAAYLFGHEALAITQESTLVTVSSLEGDKVHAFNEHFHTDLVAKGKADIVISKYDLSGQRLWSQVGGTEGNDLPVAVTTSKDKVYVASNVEVARATELKLSQTDIGLVALDLGTGKEQWSKTIDGSLEDIATSVVVWDDEITIGGGLGALVTTDGYFTKPYDATLWHVGLDGTLINGNVINGNSWGTPRSDGVLSLSVSDSRLWAGGFVDGPTNPQSEKDPNQQYQGGFVNVFYKPMVRQAPEPPKTLPIRQ